MSRKRDWCEIVTAQEFEDFLAIKFGIFADRVEKRYNKNYGTYFSVYENNKLEVEYYGKFGKIDGAVVCGRVVFYDDFEYSEQNPLFVEEYVKFIANKIQGCGKKKSGNTLYFREYNQGYEEYLESKKEEEKE